MFFSAAYQSFTQPVDGRDPPTCVDHFFRCCGRRWLASWDHLELDDITTERVGAYFAELVAKDVPPDEIRHDGRRLAVFFSWARREGLVDVDPIAGLAPLRCRKKLKSICWNENDQSRLLTVCSPVDGESRYSSRGVLPMIFLDHASRECREPYLYPLVLLGLRTGMRLGSLLYLEWRHVHLDRRCIEIPGPEARWGHDFQVELDDECVALLTDIARHCEAGGDVSQRVFECLAVPMADGVPDVDVVQIHLRAACRRSGIREGEFNSLRVSFAYNCVRSGLHWTEALKRVDWDGPDLLIRVHERWSPDRRAAS